MAGRRKGRRARGTGTIFFHRGKGRWVGRKAVGRTPAGRTRYAERWGATQAEVVRKLEAAGPPGPNVTVGQWAERWLENHPGRASTKEGYRKGVARIVKHLGAVRVRDLTPSRVEAFAAAAGRDGLHVNTVRKTLGELHNLLGAAVRDGLIPSNPVAAARKPKGVRKEIDPLGPPDLLRVMGAATDWAGGPAFTIALLAGCGCRVGEALALDVPDFDPAAGTVAITKTYDFDHGTRPPKSKNSVRTIRVPAPALSALVAAAGGRKSGPLFLTRDGNRVHVERVRDVWGRVLKRLGLRFRNVHQMRHSVATALVSAGEPLGDVAAYLGDTVESIVKHYVHRAGTDPAATLERLYGGRKVGTTGGRRRKPA